MKNYLFKISAVLLCVSMLFALSACGDKDDADSKEDTPAVTVVEPESETTQNDKPDSGDDIVLPEDGKIVFGDKDKDGKTTEKTDDKKVTKSSVTKKSDTKKTTTTTQKTDKEKVTTTKEKTTTTTTSAGSKTTTTQSTTKNTTTANGGSSADEKDWGGISWN